MNPGVVVKIGGSLARTGRAAHALAEVVASGAERPLVLSGGGAEVDRVREAYRRGELEGRDAYWEAVRALDRMAARLVAVHQARGQVESVRLCGDLEACRTAWRQDRVPVLTPYPVIRPVEGFPVAWETTSDSIAAWVAGRIAAPLLLVKARPPRGRAAAEVEGGAPAFPVATLVQEGLVDAGLPGLLAGPDAPAACWVLDGSRSGRLRTWLEGDREVGARVLADG